MAIAAQINQTKYQVFRWRYELSVPKKLALALGIACLTGLAAQIRFMLPWSPVPVTGQTFAVLLAPLVVYGVCFPMARYFHSSHHAEAGARVVEARDLARLPRADILLLAPHALDDLAVAQGPPTVGGGSGARASLADFVRRGGSVVVLEQSRYPKGLLPARLLDRGCTIAFRRTTDPLVFRGTEAEDFRFWRGDHVVARKTIAKPTEGRFLAHVDSGGPDGLVYLPLLEIRDGRGRYLLSQLLIGEKLGKEPLAGLMLENLLHRAAVPPPPPKPIPRPGALAYPGTSKPVQ